MNVRQFTSTAGSWLAIHDQMWVVLQARHRSLNLVVQLTFNLWRLPRQPWRALYGTGFETRVSARTSCRHVETRDYENHFEMARPADRPVEDLRHPLLAAVGAGRGFTHRRRSLHEKQELRRLLEAALLYWNTDPGRTPFSQLRPRAEATQPWSLLLCLNFLYGRAVYTTAYDALADAD